MTITYTNVILLSWLMFLVVWALLSLNVKRDVHSLWLRYWLLRLVAAAFVIFVVTSFVTGKAYYANSGAVFTHDLFAPSPIIGWLAATLTVFGIAFAIWARFYLGRNWSPRPAVKENPELVTTGPYAYVRHPIYAGIFLAEFSFMLLGGIFGIGVVAIASVIFLLRINKEEKIMLELFPNKYPAYQKRTKRLVPFVW